MNTRIEQKHPVSVIMPVYNGAKYLRLAIDSILSQTYHDFELIIIDDGSKDNSWEIIQNYNNNSKVKIYTQKNVGLAETLNRAIRLSKNEFIARQDQDDISLPSRLEVQMDYLVKNPEVDLVGSWAQILEENVLVDRFLKHEIEDKKIKTFVLFDTPFVHTSVLFRKSSVERAGLYSTSTANQPPEDYELWSRMASKFKFSNIPKILIHYREVDSSMSRTIGDIFSKNMINAGSAYIKSITNDDCSSNLNKLYHNDLSGGSVSILQIFSLYRTAWEIINKERFNLSCSVARAHLKTLYKNYFKLKLGVLK